MYNKIKIDVWRTMLSLMGVCVALMMGSCTEEISSDGDLSIPEGSFVVKLGLPESAPKSKADPANPLDTWNADLPHESQIDNITILVFNKADGSLDTWKRVILKEVNGESLSSAEDINYWNTHNQSVLLNKFKTPKTVKNIYAIANWAEGKDITESYKESVFKTQSISAPRMPGVAAATPITMSGSKSDVTLSAQSSVAISLMRCLARVSIRVEDNSAGKLPLNCTLDYNSIRLMIFDIATQAYIIPQGNNKGPVGVVSPPSIGPHTTTNLTTYHFGSANGSSSFSATNCIYVGEWAAGVAGFFVIQVPYTLNGKYEKDNYYVIKMDLLRNKYFTGTLVITGLGSQVIDVAEKMKGATFETTVLDWSLYANDDIYHTDLFINIDRTKVEFQCFDKELKVSFGTNVSQWQLVDVTTAGVEKVILSYDRATHNNGITYPEIVDTDLIFKYDAKLASDNVVSNCLITVTRNRADAPPYYDNVNFATKKLKLRSQNITIPITVTEDNGIIPRSEMEKVGWNPSLAECPRGLQVARRGNVLPTAPGGNEEANDRVIKWGEFGVLLGHLGLSNGYGGGKKNTRLLLDYAKTRVPPTSFPAVEVCAKLGSDWFLPSPDELFLLYNVFFAKTLGSSYAYDHAGEYYTSYSDDNMMPYQYGEWNERGCSCQTVRFGWGSFKLWNSTKNDRNPVYPDSQVTTRCVRYI